MCSYCSYLTVIAQGKCEIRSLQLLSILPSGDVLVSDPPWARPVNIYTPPVKGFVCLFKEMTINKHRKETSKLLASVVLPV